MRFISSVVLYSRTVYPNVKNAVGWVTGVDSADTARALAIDAALKRYPEHNSVVSAVATDIDQMMIDILSYEKEQMNVQ